MDKNYEGDVLYDTWRMGGNPDFVDPDRVEDYYEEGLYSEEVAQRELDIQQKNNAYYN
jgi:hypothetical protein